jgi:hypothetical protein
MPVFASHRKAGISPVLATEARIEATSHFDPGFHFSGDTYEIAGRPAS